METTQKSSILTTVLIAILIGLLSGGGIYFWQQEEAKHLNNRIERLEQELNEAQNKPPVTIEKEVEKPVPPSAESSLGFKKEDFPFIHFSREGLLTAAERKILEAKLINPMILYYNEKEVELISLSIVVPQNVGQDYEVTAIFKNGGTSDFLFGKREQQYNFWGPGCMGPCPFTEAFKKKYPNIVEASE